MSPHYPMYLRTKTGALGLLFFMCRASSHTFHANTMDVVRSPDSRLGWTQQQRFALSEGGHWKADCQSATCSLRAEYQMDMTSGMRVLPQVRRRSTRWQCRAIAPFHKPESMSQRVEAREHEPEIRDQCLLSLVLQFAVCGLHPCLSVSSSPPVY